MLRAPCRMLAAMHWRGGRPAAPGAARVVRPGAASAAAAAVAPPLPVDLGGRRVAVQAGMTAGGLARAAKMAPERVVAMLARELRGGSGGVPAAVSAETVVSLDLAQLLVLDACGHRTAGGVSAGGAG
jgi:hypothetical protein